MTKEIFMRELINGLAELGPDEQKQVSDYYEELICDGMESGRSEDAIIESFGSPAEISAQIRAEYQVRANGGKPGAATRVPVETEYRATGDIHTIIVEASNVRVQMRTVEDGPVRVLFQPRENDKVNYSEVDGVFTFEHNMDMFNLWSWIDILRGPHEITVEVPASYTGKLRLKTSNASVGASGLLHAGECQFSTSNARVNVQHWGCTALTAKSANGSISVVDLSCEAGDIATSNARISAEHCRFTEHLWLQTSNGSIHAHEMETPDLLMKTANGSITALIVGAGAEYQVESHTSNASNNLPVNSGTPELTKRLRATSCNGRIDVRFTQA